MEHIRVKEILEATGGLLLGGDPETPLCHISIDSRNMRGQDLFVPLIGEKNDAHRFIGKALENGAAASLTSEHEEMPGNFDGALIRVEDTRKALQDIGRFLRSRIRIPLVGITGSVGKTTTREMVAAALSAGYKTFKTPANHNSQIGVPLTLSEIADTDEIGVLELGMSEPGEMEVIAEIASVDTAVMTNIGVTHIENLGSRENILTEKLHIQDGMKEGGVLIVNGDNDMLRDVEPKAGCTLIRYGFGEHNDYRAENMLVVGGCPCFTMVHGDRRIRVTLRVMGEHNALNALAALAVADQYHVPLGDAADALYHFEGFKNRQQIYKTGGITIIDDTYNASPDSMKAGIKVLASLPAARRIAVLADMKELGEDTLTFHREVGEFLAGQPVDELVAYGGLARAIAEGAGKAKETMAAPGGAGTTSGSATSGSAKDAATEKPLKITLFDEAQKPEMTAYLEAELREGDAVLFKGSNSMKLFETAAHFIRENNEEA